MICTRNYTTTTANTLAEHLEKAAAFERQALLHAERGHGDIAGEFARWAYFEVRRAYPELDGYVREPHQPKALVRVLALRSRIYDILQKRPMWIDE